ncbi:hypothetical protein [Actinomadura kijaniata]|uniref:hypothetical protein n=1 Tax=Actinomadura kijaniata TaxID=46161 RepID=UPI00082CD38B|nr:hypothetical protein [Actinomadura kijaniata]
MLPSRTGGTVPADASFGACASPVHIVNGQWVIGHAGVILGNHDDLPFFVERAVQTITSRR